MGYIGEYICTCLYTYQILHYGWINIFLFNSNGEEILDESHRYCHDATVTTL